MWVGILGLCVFYLYAIISFAMMRSMFNPDDYLYCDTLWQCTLTVIRYGLIGDLFDVRMNICVYILYVTNSKVIKSEKRISGNTSLKTQLPDTAEKERK